MKLVYSRRARSNIAEIFSYIATQDLQVASDVETDIRMACERLLQGAYRHSRTSRPNVFRMPIGKRGYTVFYHVRPKLGRIDILGVVRSRRVKSLSKVPR